MDTVISCPKESHDRAGQLALELRRRGFQVGILDQPRRPSDLFSAELLKHIRESQSMLLLWSASARKDRSVRAEWLAAFHEQRFIIPCALDDAPLPRFLTNLRPIDMRHELTVEADALERTVRAVPQYSNPVFPVGETDDPNLRQMIHTIACSQVLVLTMLGDWRLTEARQEQERSVGLVRKGLTLAHDDPMITKLAGFHYKNQYWIEHGEALKAGQLPLSPLLTQAEMCFFQSLERDPTDAEALNGLGGTLMLKGDFNGAEYLQRRAIYIVEAEGERYISAERDLERTLAFRAMSRHRFS